MKILFVTFYFPFPMLNGAQIRTYNVLKLLGRKHEIHLFGLLGENVGEDEILHMKNYCASVECANLPDRNSLPRYIKSLFHPLPYKVFHAYHPKIHHRLIEMAKKENYDLVFIDHTFMAGYNLFHMHIPHVLTLHNLEYRLMEKYSKDPVGLRKIYGIHQLSPIKNFETNLCNRFDCSIFVSKVEEEIVKKYHPEVRTAHIPNGVDINRFKPSPIEKKDGAQLVFVGNYNNFPNVEAVHYFMKEIFPLIQKRVPSAIFDIVGLNPPPSFKKYASSHVRVIGHVEDTRERINPAQVVVIPLKTGAGTKLKVIEAMAMGKGIVTTPVGADGIISKNGENLFIADEPQQFAEQVCNLLSNNELRIKIGEAARSTVVRHYSWDSIVERLEKVLCSIVSEKSERVMAS